MPHTMHAERTPDPRRSQGGVTGVVAAAVACALSLFVLIEVNFSLLTPLKSLALFATAGLVLTFLRQPSPARPQGWRLRRGFDFACAVAAVVCCGYLLVQGASLGQRAAVYTSSDLGVGMVGLLLVLEATRRSIGWALPLLCLLFVVYAHESVARELPEWLFPHRGQDGQALIGQTYLRTEGVFGTALSVMFRYVFLFVLFGAFLQASGATHYIISLALRFFGRRAGGPAKVAVLASGLMGSLSGSAVANAATTGTFTIPLMRSIGFPAHVAAGIEAAASSGGALVPPVMGAGAYMMLEIINRDPPVSYLEILRAALVPAGLYYFSIFALVHFYARRIDAEAGDAGPRVAEGAAERGRPAGAAPPLENIPSVNDQQPILSWEGLTFFGSLGSLMLLLLLGASPFRAVTFALAYVLLLILLNPRTPACWTARLAGVAAWVLLTVAAKVVAPGAERWPDALIWGMAATLLAGLGSPAWRGLVWEALGGSARAGVPLIMAAACVGIVIGLVSRTGIGTGLPQAIIPLAGNHLFLGLLAIMGCSLVLGMGLPSAVSYLLLATIIGPVFADPSLGVPLLVAHLFIFYFGMMAMVTPPVALAAYATASLAGARVMQASWAAFRFALVGFTLPFMFVYRPALCLIGADGGHPGVLEVAVAVGAAVVGIVALAAAMAGYLFSPVAGVGRVVLFLAAACALFPDQYPLWGTRLQLFDLVGMLLLAAVGLGNYRAGGPARPTAAAAGE